MHFNPRSPHGERQHSAPDATRCLHFNPRSPHGERLSRILRSLCPVHISTHAPRTGSDSNDETANTRIVQFQPTLPARGATLRSSTPSASAMISTHAPRTGSDLDDPPNIRNARLSTHAPRTGSDCTAQGLHAAPQTFQPTLPARGATFGFVHFTHAPPYFNPRSPHGERPAFVIPLTTPQAFQPTLPARGATGHTSALAIPERYFNPRSPHGERRISSRVCFTMKPFQPTLPARGATRIGDSRTMKKYFNPRSPHGERQRKATILSTRIRGFAQKVYHKTVLLRIILAENAVISPKRPQNPVRTSLQKAGGLRFARAIRTARPYSISSPSGA